MGDQSADETKHDFEYLDDLPSCPPPEASSVEGEFYVFHRANPPGDADFRTAAQRAVFLNGQECKRRSNSVWSDLAALKKKVHDLKRRQRKEKFFISAGEVKRDHGVLDGQSDPHWSFWVCNQHSMHDIFNNFQEQVK